MEAGKLALGTLLQNRYRLLSLLGQGGMGAVYLAEDQRFRSKVAVKETCFTEERLRQAFAHEAGLLHRLRHPALPRVMDHFSEAEGQYLVMDFIPGKDLEELLAERKRQTGGTFAVEQVLRWADQLLDALEYLHGHQPAVVHRDIKPQNLKLTPRGEVILLDFGLAKGAATEMSQAGMSLRGYTRHYAALEQIQGTGTDARSDLYALAATLYRLLTGNLPPDSLTRATAALSKRPDPLRPINELNARVPRSVAAVIVRALAQDPDERPTSATEMRRALREAGKSNVAADSSVLPLFGEPEMGNELHSTIGEEPGIASKDAASVHNLPSTYAGQALSSSAIVTGPTLRREDTVVGVVSRRSRSRAVLISGVALIILLAGAAWAYWQWKQKRESLATISPPAVSGAVLPAGTTPTQAAPSEVLRYYVQLESARGKAGRVVGPEPVVANRWWKFYFTPSQRGYLYIVGPNERGTQATFLTARPNSDWGVKGNLIEAEGDYVFPPRRDKWIRLTSGAGDEIYTVIFAPERLTEPGFLARPAGRELTAEEQQELAALREKYGRQVRQETQGDQSIVAAPAERAGGGLFQPVLFDIKLRRR